MKPDILAEGLAIQINEQSKPLQKKVVSNSNNIE